MMDALWQQRMSRMVGHVDGNLVQRLGDNAGANKLSIRDSDDVEVAWIDSDGNCWLNGATSSTNLKILNSSGAVVGEAYNEQNGVDRHIVTLEAGALAGEDSFINLRATGPADKIGSVVIQSELNGGGKVALIVAHSEASESYVEFDADHVYSYAPMTITPLTAQPPFILDANAQGQKVVGLNADLLDGYDAAATGANAHVLVTGASGGVTLAGQITSGVATGTAPLSIASTTKVANLNVDQVDGYDTATAATASTVVARDASGSVTVVAVSAVSVVSAYNEGVSLIDTGTAANSSTGIGWRNSTYAWDQGRIAVIRRGSTNNFDMAFWTSVTGVLAERLRITSAGTLLHGKTAASGTDGAGNAEINGALRVGGGLGVNGNAAQGKVASGGALSVAVQNLGFGTATEAQFNALVNLVNAIRTTLVNNGQMS
jgi:hypothetical protein